MERGHFMKKTPFLTLEKAREIAAQIPTPFHIYDEAGIRENVRALQRAFAWNPGFREYFAVKATPNPYILKIFQEEGCGCDCASYAELLLCEAVGITGHDIMFSSNVTPEKDLRKARDMGAYINLDDATYVDFLFNAGVTKGYDDGSFKPNQNITRAQFSVMLYRYLGLQEEDYDGVELPFEDLNQIGEYAVPAIKALYSEGVINGSVKNGKLYFNPNSPLTRAQAATMIGRTQKKGYALSDLMFTDAEKIPAYATYYIQTMAAQGILSGYADNTFRPNNNITRGQMAKILYNLM